MPKGRKAMIETEDYDALHFIPEDEKLTLVRLPAIKSCADHDVVVRTAYAGVCGTDMQIVAGKFPCKSAPVVLGHEISGVVHSIGKLVRNVSIGERVVINPHSRCSCNRKEPHFCNTGPQETWLGIMNDGGWAEYCVVNEDQVFRLPKMVTLEQAVLCDSLSHVLHAWNHIANVSRGDVILLLGGGLAGHLMASILHVQAYRNVIITEPNHDRRMTLKELVPDFAVVTPDYIQKQRSKDSSWGVNVVFDCSANATAIDAALKSLLPGGKLVLLKLLPENREISVSPYEIYINELQIIGSLVNPCLYPEVLNWMEALGERYLNFDKLNIQTFNLDTYQEMTEVYENRIILKAVFKM